MPFSAPLHSPRELSQDKTLPLPLSVLVSQAGWRCYHHWHGEGFRCPAGPSHRSLKSSRADSTWVSPMGTGEGTPPGDPGAAWGKRGEAKARAPSPMPRPQQLCGPRSHKETYIHQHGHQAKHEQDRLFWAAVTGPVNAMCQHWPGPPASEIPSAPVDQVPKPGYLARARFHL